MNNYTIKRVLPRLVIGVVLVNVSYYICQIAVDLSNILGTAIVSAIGNIDIGFSGGTVSLTGKALSWSTIISGVLAAGIVAALAISIPVILGAVLVLIVIVLILVGRQAAVVVLTVVSPLAFLAFILPNTEQWFRKWLSMFTKLLLLFVIISLLFGGGNLVSNIIMNVAGSDWSLQLVAAGASIIPLIATPSLLKGALDAFGAASNLVKGLASGAGKMTMSGIKSSRAGDMWQMHQRNVATRRARAKAGIRTPRRGGWANPANWVNATGALGNRALNRLTPNLASRYDQVAGQLELKEFNEAVERANMAQTNANLSNEQRANIVTTGRWYDDSRRASAAEIAAASQHVLSVGNFDERRRIYAATAGIRGNANLSVGNQNRILRSISDSFYQRGDNRIYGGLAGEHIAAAGGGFNGDGLTQAALANLNNISDATLAEDMYRARYVGELVQNHNLPQDTRNSLATAAHGAIHNPNLNQGWATEHRQAIEAIEAIGEPEPRPADPNAGPQNPQPAPNWIPPNIGTPPPGQGRPPAPPPGGINPNTPPPGGPRP